MLNFIEDKSFDLTKTNQYKLSIQLCLNGFSFFVINNEGNKLLAYKDTSLAISHKNFMARRLKELITTEAILQKEYQHVEITLYEQNFALIPNDLFDEEKAKDLPLSIINDFSKEKIITNNLESEDYKIIFPICIELENALKDKFTSVEINHPIKKLQQIITSVEEKHCSLLHFYGNHFYLLQKKDNKLTLANSFDYKNTEDVIFYLKSALKDNKSAIYLTGKCNIEDITTKVEQYVGNVKELTNNTAISYSEDFNIKDREYLTLL